MATPVQVVRLSRDKVFAGHLNRVDDSETTQHDLIERHEAATPTTAEQTAAAAASTESERRSCPDAAKAAATERSFSRGGAVFNRRKVLAGFQTNLNSS